MDNDLISRTEVLKFIEKIKCDSNIPKNYGTLLDIMRYVRKLPVAYNVGKAVELLSEEYEDNVDIDTGVPCNNWVVDMQNEIIDKCIRIVKYGVIK